MDALAVFGIFGFVLSLAAMSRIKHLEQLLRENGIRSTGAGPLASQLRNKLGQTFTFTMSDGTSTPCKVLDVDEEWVHILRNEGKKSQREMLVRLCDVNQVKN